MHFAAFYSLLHGAAWLVDVGAIAESAFCYIPAQLWEVAIQLFRQDVP
jgi:hypothetical protein